MLLTMMITVAATCGLFLVIWGILDVCLLPLTEKGTYHIVILDGDAAQTEQRIRACSRLRRRRGLWGQWIFVDHGLSAEARSVAQLALRKQQGVSLCSPEELLLELERETIGTGTDQRNDCRGGV